MWTPVHFLLRHVTWEKYHDFSVKRDILLLQKVNVRRKIGTNSKITLHPQGYKRGVQTKNFNFFYSGISYSLIFLLSKIGSYFTQIALLLNGLQVNGGGVVPRVH